MEKATGLTAAEFSQQPKLLSNLRIPQHSHHYCLTQLNKTWCWVLFIYYSSFWCVPAHTVRVSDGAHRRLRHALSSLRSPSDPFGHVKMLPSVHMGDAGWCTSRNTFHFLFQYKWFMVRDGPSCTQNTTTPPAMGCTLLPSCSCLCIACIDVSSGFCIKKPPK